MMLMLMVKLCMRFMSTESFPSVCNFNAISFKGNVLKEPVFKSFKYKEEVIEEDETLHIIKLTGYKPRKVKTLQEAKPSLKRKVKNKLMKKGLDKWRASLREKATIEIIDIAVD